MIGGWLADRDGTQSAMDEALWRRTIQRRALVVLVLLGAWGATIQGRLVQVQVLQHDAYAARARAQQERQIEVVAARGDIVDRRGELLAYSVDARALRADPGLMEDPDLAVAQLCEALRDCSTSERRDWREQFTRETRYVKLRPSRRVSPAQAARLADLDLRWVILSTESRRYYPRRQLASHILGYVGDDNRGLGGVESRFDGLVRGEPGLVNVRRDARRNRLLTEVWKSATTGASLELTIDQRLQYIAERELLAGIAETRALAGTAIVLAPDTGEILALANYPTFNPNDYQTSSVDHRRNRAVQDVYEPGSTFKIVTASAALQEGLYTPDTLVDVVGGRLAVPGRRKPILDDHPSGVPLRFEDVIVKSSNVGAARIGLTMGAERLTLFARRFGFGQRLAPNFAGESGGVLYEPSRLNDAALATVSMGYQVSVTPLQMAAAMGAIANGGRLMAPYVVRAVIRDGVREPVEPTVIRQAIDPETAATLRAFLENVVSRGTARAAQLARHRAAGKTGTSKKAIPGGYSETDRNSSFVGFVPSRRPEFTILVVIDTPRNGQVYGGAVAAPVFKRIAEAALHLYGVTPTINPDPPVVVTEPSADRAMPVLTTYRRNAPAGPGGRSVMPDVRGLSARDALDVLYQAGLEVRIAGSGNVESQTPAAGALIEPGHWGALQLRRGATRPPDGAASGGGR
jgi:cell division protein FtsI (penicillin-binding protein 3)